jgi:hypothetical protein
MLQVYTRVPSCYSCYSLDNTKSRLVSNFVQKLGAYALCTTGQYAVRFVPRENGVHLIHVRQNSVPIHGSPFRVLVGKLDADAAKVRAFGDGLSKGETGKFSFV